MTKDLIAELFASLWLERRRRKERRKEEDEEGKKEG